MKNTKLLILSCLLGVLFGTSAGALQAATTERVSVDSFGVGGNGDSFSTPNISDNGRFVSFHSAANNLVSDDTNNMRDVFVHDRDTGVTERVSVDSFGVQGNSDSLYPALSADGRYVAFYSKASNLVANDTNGQFDIFVHDRDTGVTERVSVDSFGNQGNRQSAFAAISADGRYVVFTSLSTNLVVGDTNNQQDIFVHDRDTKITERVSVDSNGLQSNGSSSSPQISGDGRYIAFDSTATNLVLGDNNNDYDAFVYDRLTGITEQVSINSFGSGGNGKSGLPSLSYDGRFAVFVSEASNLVSGDTNAVSDIFVHDRLSMVTERVSIDSNGNQGNKNSYSPAISANGRYVTFLAAARLVPYDVDTNTSPDIYLFDRNTRITELISVDSFGNQPCCGGNGNSTVTPDGQVVAFVSYMPLDPDDTNGTGDIYVRDRGESNQAPIAVINGPYSVTEGGSILLDASGSSDPEDDALSFAWDLDNDGSFDDATGATTTFSAHDLDGPTNAVVQVLVTDMNGAIDVASITVSIQNAAPSISNLNTPATPLALGTAADITFNITDPGADMVSVVIEWGDGTTNEASTNNQTLTASHTYAEPDAYTLNITATDDDGVSVHTSYQFIVMYDPNGSFVTGGGWINSQAGACRMNTICTNATGKLNFSFISKYKKESNIPSGNTDFTFKAGDLSFHSDTYEWMTINQNNSNAQLLGNGLINGKTAPNGSPYQMIIWARDRSPSGMEDTVRIKLWYNDAGQEVIIYDNGSDQALGGGSIVIHSS